MLIGERTVGALPTQAPDAASNDIIQTRNPLCHENKMFRLGNVMYLSLIRSKFC